MIYEDFDEDPFVMNIVVKDSKDFTLLELAEAVALAVVDFTPLPADMVEGSGWKIWKSGKFRKLLKRMKVKDFSKLVESLSEDGIETHSYTRGNVDLVVVEPVRKSFVNKILKRAQVSGLTTLPEDHDFVNMYGVPVVSLNSDLNMGAGKASVAAAHALQVLRDSMSPSDLNMWSRNKRILVKWEPLGVVPSVSSESVQENVANIEKLREDFDVVIEDSGFTEVVSGSVTAVAKWTGSVALYRYL